VLIENLRSKHPRSASISIDNIVDCCPVGHADHPADYHVDSPNEDLTPTFTNGLAAHEKVARLQIYGKNGTQGVLVHW
jgi:hypothetical protein